MGHHRGDDRKAAKLFGDPNHNVQGLDSDDELEAALRRELSELSGCDQCLDPEADQTERESLMYVIRSAAVAVAFFATAIFVCALGLLTVPHAVLGSIPSQSETPRQNTPATGSKIQVVVQGEAT